MTMPTLAGVAETTKGIEELVAEHRHGCIRGCLLGRDRVTGVLTVVPLCCKSWNCPECAVRLQKQWALVAAMGEPTKFLTLTGDPELHSDPKEMRIAMKKAFTSFVAHWRRGRPAKGDRHKIPEHELEYMAVWELHKSGYPHLHVLIRGDFIPQSYLKSWMSRAGVGEIVHIMKVVNHHHAARELLKYLTKAAQDVSGALDGARLITCSRNFRPDALPDPDDENTADVEWIRLPASPADVVADLVHGELYNISFDSLPHAVQLLPTHFDRPLEFLVAAIGKRLNFSS